MPVCLPIWRRLRPPESVAVCRCAVVMLPEMQQSHRWNRCDSSQTSSQVETSRCPVRADPFKWSCHFITLKESEREREDGERETASPPVKTTHCHRYREAPLMSWKYSARKAAVWHCVERERERDLTHFLRSDEMNSRTDRTKTFWGFHHLLPDYCLSS